MVPQNCSVSHIVLLNTKEDILKKDIQTGLELLEGE